MSEEKISVEEQVTLIKGDVALFLHDAEKITNKTAARRARTCSLAIEKKLKRFRKDSLK